MSRTSAANDPFDVTQLSATQVRGMIEESRNFDRENWVLLLQYIDDSDAIVVAEEMCSEERKEKGVIVAAALSVLERRDTARACVVARSLLKRRSGEIRMAALDALVNSGRTEDDVRAVLDFALARLKGSGHLVSPYPGEIPQYFRFAQRTGSLPTLARIVTKHWEHLHTDEQEEIARLWPDFSMQDLNRPQLADELWSWEKRDGNYVGAPGAEGWTQAEEASARDALVRMLAPKWSAQVRD